jgi:hypothetical protein
MVGQLALGDHGDGADGQSSGVVTLVVRLKAVE